MDATVNETVSGLENETIEVGPGETATSFDDLSAARSRAEESVKSSSGPDKSKEKDKKKSDDETDPESGDDKPQKDKDQDAKTAKAAKDDKLKAGEKPPKVYKIKAGDTETELPATAQVPVTVDGKEELVTLEQLRADYSGKKSWSNEFGKLGAEKQKFKQERDTVMSKLGEMFQGSQKDPIQGLMKMAEMAGMNPVQYRKDFLEAINPLLEKRLEMSDAERRAADAEVEADFYRSQTQSRLESERQEREFRDFEAQVTRQIEAAGVTKDQFEATYSILAKAAQSGEFVPRSGSITVEDVLNVAATESYLSASDEAFEELGLKLEDSEKDKFLAKLIPMARSSKMSPKIVKETVKEFFKDRKASNLSQKVRASQPKAAPKATAPKNFASEPMTFDDL